MQKNYIWLDSFSKSIILQFKFQSYKLVQFCPCIFVLQNSEIFHFNLLNWKYLARSHPILSRISEKKTKNPLQFSSL